MPAAPVSSQEMKRLAAVRKSRLLGTPAEERFDQITRLARRMFNVPMAIIDIVGDKMAWLKSVQGFDRFEVLREHSYCHYTVLGDEVCLIHDARLDPRVSDNPYAAAFVFYAGVPLKLDGQNVGVLCIADSQPRGISEAEIDALLDLAALAERELEVAVMSEMQLALAASNEELEMKSSIDVLTRIWNRGAISDVLASELQQARERAQTLGVAVLDIDHFKVVNDTYGHAAGDEVLRVVSQRLRAASRATDAIGRYGGEEFLIVLPDVSSSSLQVICDRMRVAIASEPVSFDGHAISVTCSIGAVLSGGAEATETESLLRSADQELYRAKRSGRDRAFVTISSAAPTAAAP